MVPARLRPHPWPRRIRVSERPQEVDEVLLIRSAERVEVVNDGIGFGRAVRNPALTHAGVAEMVLNRLDDVGSAAIMQEEDPLAYSPQGRRAKLVARGVALDDAIRQPRPHMVEQ